MRLARSIGSTDPLLIASPLSPESPDIPSWVTNPIAPIESAYAKAKGDLREMFSLYGGRLSLAGDAPPLADIAPIVDERHLGGICDVVLGVAMPDPEAEREDRAAREWGLVSVGLLSGVIVVLDDASGALSSREALDRARLLCSRRRASVLAAPSEQADALAQELLAAYAGTGLPFAPISPERVRDGSALRVGPLRTLYDRERLRYAAEHADLTAAQRSWLPGRRAPRVEALIAAVLRLASCYPWLSVEPTQAPVVRAPVPVLLGSGGLRGAALFKKLGCR
jgi:hypothetical protein